MMGHRSKRFKLFTETDLEALVPADNFFRRLEGCLDLSFSVSCAQIPIDGVVRRMSEVTCG